MGLKESRVVDDEGQEHRKRPQQEGWEELGNDWALDGIANDSLMTQKKSASRVNLRGDWAQTLTRRLSTGLVTLNLSIVLTMMAGVVMKKSSRKRRMLRRTQRSHQREPHTDRFSLEMREIMSSSSQSSSKTDRAVNTLQSPGTPGRHVLT